MSLCNPETRSRAQAVARTLTTIVIALTSTVVIALAGCASSSGIAPSATLVDPAKVGVSAAPAAPLAPDWWQGFADKDLAALIDQAVAGSPSLRVAQARVARAAANAGIARAAEGPQLTGSFDATRQRYTENGIYPPPLAGSVNDSASLQLNGSWELDLFGRNRAALDAAIGAQRAAEADAAAARVVLAVNVARSYVQLARLLEQREVLQRSLTQRDQVLGLIRQRVSAGLDTTAELYLGEGALPETRAQIEGTDEQIALTRHAIAALAALPPDAADKLAPRLSAVRAVPVPELVPADLLGRRADIVAARWRVEAASGDVAAARAQFYPNINLVAFVGLSTLGLDRLLQAGSAQYGVGPAIRLPIFDSGRLRANLSGRTAELDAAIAGYNGSVIDAVHDVADQISSSRSLERQLREQGDAVASAERAYDVATQRYRAGLATYLTVLSAETNVLAQRRLGVDIRARTLDTQMLLVRALGGGYVAPAAVS
ncbi:MAG: efflux transporter outer membrane subunit [Burkholderiales bacterium]|nr:efflux transporter outer membrane subunit [Burkholderiales bacterium]